MSEIDFDTRVTQRVGKDNPMVVPVGYFDELPSRIQNRCIASNRSTSFSSKQQPLRNRFALAFGVVSLAAVFYVGYLFIHPFHTVSLLRVDEPFGIVQKQVAGVDIPDIHNHYPKEVDVAAQEDYREQIINYLIDERVDYVTLMEVYHYDE